MPTANRRTRKRSKKQPVTRDQARSGRNRAQQTWRNAAERLEAEIASGRFGDAGKLPKEAQLATELELSRHTLRRAVAELVNKGLLRNVPHIGTYVAPRRIAFTIESDSRFFEALREAGLTPGIRQLERRTTIAPFAVARRLGVAARTQVIEIVQLLTGNDLPLGCVILRLPADRFARIGELIDATGSLRRAMAQIGIPRYSRRAVEITSSRPSPQERGWLGLGKDDIVLTIEGVSVDSSGEATHAFRYCMVADRVMLIVEP